MQASMVWRITRDISVDRLSARELTSIRKQKSTHAGKNKKKLKKKTHTHFTKSFNLQVKPKGGISLLLY
jgi:hypothetical protein